MQRQNSMGLCTDPDGLWVTAPRLIARITSTFRDRATETETGVFDLFSRVGSLVIDDLGAEKTTDFSLTSFYSILAHRIDYLKYTIVTSNCSIEDIGKWSARIASRLSSFKIIKLMGADRRTKGKL